MSKLAYTYKWKARVSLAVLTVALGTVSQASYAAPPSFGEASGATPAATSAAPPVPDALMPSTQTATPTTPAEAAAIQGQTTAAPGETVAPTTFAPPPLALPPATTTQPASTASQSQSAADLPPGVIAPSLSEIIGQTGSQVEQPAALPPGFALPLDEAQSSQVDEKTKEEQEAEIRKKAFDSAISGLYALHPEEVRRLLERSDEQKQAIEVPIYSNPNMESAFATISLDPGEKPLVVKTAIGHVTTLSMVDATGQPWPIKDITWAGNFEVQQPDDGSNILRITPLSEFAQGNLSMSMVGLNPPVILSFRADRQNVHVRLDVQIPEIGPNGVAPLISSNLTSAAAGNAQLASVLEGIAPSKAKKMTVNGVDGRTSAYDAGGTMYVRTPYTLLSPAWNSSVRSADGTNVYSLASTPVLLLSDKGKMVRAYLSGEEKADGQ